MSELVVHQLPAGWGLPSISPFCLKLDAYLRLAGIPFRAVVDSAPFGAPKGKLPYIEYDGRRIGDSGLIIEYLERVHGGGPDARLSAAERATSLALRRLIEENLYWTLVYDRWMVDANWKLSRDVILGAIPLLLRRVIGPVARRGVRRQLVGHGIGVHSGDEIHAIGQRDLGALSDFLGDKPYFHGETPTEIDAIAYGFLANLIEVPIASPVKDFACGKRNLVDFVARMRGRYFA